MPVDPVDEDGQPGVDPRVLGLAAADTKADDTDLGPLAVLVLNILVRSLVLKLLNNQ